MSLDHPRTDEGEASAPTVDTDKPRPIFAIFEGGGAKGVAHVGALQAVQDNGLEIVGVAGTSAGALIAAMAAIGLEANDIMSADEQGEDILTRAGTSPVELLGARDWRHFQRLRNRGLIAGLLLLIGGLLLPSIFAARNTVTVGRLVGRKGHFTTDRIRDFINEVIRQRLTQIRDEAGLDWPVPDHPTFEDLARGWPTVVPLKIVATDVDRGSLELFDADVTKKVVVAEAVAASISIPLIFQPAAIPSFRTGRFADGGLVSNLPIWGFSEEKLGREREHYADPPVPIVGFTLAAPRSDEDPAKARLGILGYLKKLVYAALQGSQGSALRFLDDVVIVPLESSLDMLAFDEGWAAYSAARESGRHSADRHLRFALDIKPDRIRKELVTVRDEALVCINKHRDRRGRPPVEQLRLNLIRPFGVHSLRVMESLNMEQDADDRLLLDRRGRGAAEAFRARGLRVFRLGKGYNVRSKEFMTKYERALVRTSVRAVICVPIFADATAWDLEEADRPEPAGILAIDSDEPLAEEFDDNDLRNMLVAQSAILYEAVSSEMPDGEKREAGDGQGGGEAQGCRV